MNRPRFSRSIAALVTCVVWFGVREDAQAAGYALSEQGPTSSALGNAATARADLPEAGFYNPAAYALRSSASLSSALLFPSISHQDQETTYALTDSAFVPQLHLGANIGNFGVSFSLDVPFASGVEWPEDWAGRYESTGSSLQVIELGANVSSYLFDVVAISAGVRLQNAQFGTSRRIGTARSGSPPWMAKFDALACVIRLSCFLLCSSNVANANRYSRARSRRALPRPRPRARAG